MKRLFLLIFLYIPCLLQAQTPTDYPPVRTKELPQDMQDPFTVFLIVVGSLAVVLLILYFIRFDKWLAKWWRNR